MGFLSSLFRAHKKDPSGDADEAATRAAIEQLVEDVDPRIRLIRGYRKKLRPGVEIALKHARDIAARLPGPFALDTNTWRTEPLINVAFARADELPAAISRSVEVREFFERGAGKFSPECFALFGMQREERSVFGKELVGEVIHSDVIQTAVSFTNHRLVAPAASLDELRLGIARRAFHHLEEEAIDQVTRALDRKQGLEEQRAVLRLKLKVMARQRQGLQGLVEAEAPADQKTEDLEQKLAEIEARFRKLQTTLSNLENYVPHLNKVLGHPEQYLSLQQVPLRLTLMNILVTAPTEQPVHELSLEEATLRDGRKFVLSLVKCTRDQLHSQQRLLDEAVRQL